MVVMACQRAGVRACPVPDIAVPIGTVEVTGIRLGPVTARQTGSCPAQMADVEGWNDRVHADRSSHGSPLMTTYLTLVDETGYIVRYG